ncbi:MAG: hypothetical protein ACLUD2_10425 [Clostridium sp.]
MKIKRKIYWNLCLVALLTMVVSALITALLLCQDLQTQMRHSRYDGGPLSRICHGGVRRRLPGTLKEPRRR